MAKSNVMTHDRALKILELSIGFSDEDLRENYSSLVRKYHEANFIHASNEEQDMAQEKMKEINAAYDFFKDLKKRTGTYFDLESYVLEIKNKIISFAENVKICDEDLLDKVKNLISIHLSKLDGILVSSKVLFDSSLDLFLEKLKDVYIKYQTKYFEDNYIYAEDLREEIKYDRNVEDFYKQMLRLKDKYSRKIIFEKRVAEEISQYRNYATCTDNLWELIQVACVNNANLAAEKSKYQNLDSVITSLHAEINGLFKLIDEINAKFSSLSQELQDVNDSTLKEEYNEIKESYDRGASLSGVLDNLTELESKIDLYKKFQEGEPIVRGLYERVVANFNNALLTFNPVNDRENINKLFGIFGIIMDLFSKYREGLIDLDNLLLLDKVTFLDIVNDNGIINAVSINSGKVSKSTKVYLKINNMNSPLDATSFFALDDENGQYVMRKITNYGSAGTDVTLKEIEEDYISLDKVLESAEFVGKKGYGNGTSILYFINGNRAIYLDSNNLFAICGDADNTLLTARSVASEYGDKEYIKELIVAQIDEVLQQGRNY